MNRIYGGLPDMLVGITRISLWVNPKSWIREFPAIK